MIDSETEDILSELFGRHTGWENEDRAKIALSPGFEDMKALALLLRSQPREEKLQVFLEDHLQFLLGAAGMGWDDDLAFISKPAIGSKYWADFAVLNANQGGASIHLFEIEPSGIPLFTKKNMPAKRLQGALGQVRDWHQWIEPNKATYVRDMVNLAKALPLYPEKSANKSFSLREPQDLESAWREFCGFSIPHVGYNIIIGRWSKLSSEHRERLVFYNRQEGHFQQIYTYDQVARRAYIRPVVI